MTTPGTSGRRNSISSNGSSSRSGNSNTRDSGSVRRQHYNFQPFIDHLRDHSNSNGVISPSTVEAGAKKALLDTEANWKSYRDGAAGPVQLQQSKGPKEAEGAEAESAKEANSNMSSTKKDFAEQQKLANKKHSELTDTERIFLLKREIDNLRGQVREANGGSLNGSGSSKGGRSSSSSASTSGFCGGDDDANGGGFLRPLLCGHPLRGGQPIPVGPSLMMLCLLLGLVAAARLARRRKVFETVGGIVRTGLSLARERRRQRGRGAGRRMPHRHRATADANATSSSSPSTPFADPDDDGPAEEFELTEHSSSASSVSSSEPDLFGFAIDDSAAPHGATGGYVAPDVVGGTLQVV
jgi:hypothetical protein